MTTSTALREDDVLDAFAMEPDHGRATLDAYLRDYPAHASGLVALSFELTRSDIQDRELSADEEMLVEKAWERRREADPAGVANPIAALAPLTGLDDVPAVGYPLALPDSASTPPVGGASVSLGGGTIGGAVLDLVAGDALRRLGVGR